MKLWLQALAGAVLFAIGYTLADWWMRRPQPGDEDDAYWYGRA